MSRAGIVELVERRAVRLGAAAGAPLYPIATVCRAAMPTDLPMRRTCPAGWRQRPSGLEWHEGLDLRAGVGDPVYAIRPGRVIFATADVTPGFMGYGRCVVIAHGPSDAFGLAVGLDPARPIYVLFGHLSETLVSPGEWVEAGQLVARAGRSSSGLFVARPGHAAMPAHLHIGTRYERRTPHARYGIVPWPGSYPHPIRAPRELATQWIDPDVYLSAWGILPATDERSTSYVIAQGSPADCVRVPRAVVRTHAPIPVFAQDDDTATPHASGPAPSSSSSSSGESDGAGAGTAIAVVLGVGAAAAGIAAIRSRKGTR